MKNTEGKYIFHKKEDIYIKLDIDTIRFAVAEGDNISLCFIDNKTTLLRSTLKKMEESLNSDYFFRTHRSWLVNLEKVKSIDVKGEWLQIGEQKIPISRSNRKAFFEKISTLG